MPWLTRRTLAAGALATTALLGRAAAAHGQRISQVPRGETVSGISCDAMEGNRIHIHQHLTILDRGKDVPVPPDVGRPASGQCLYWVHTHTPDGVIHIESPANRTFTLGDFFAVWGQPISTTRAASAIAGKGTTLKAHTDIVIEIGPPFPTPPKFTAWAQR